MKTFLDVGVLGLAALMMLAVGLELESRHFKLLAKQIAPVSAVLLTQILLLPALGLLVSWAVPLPVHLRLGILLIVACPVGDMANFFTLLGRGNLALSVTMNAISCLLSPVSMVLVFTAYGRVLGSPFLFSIPSWGLVLRFLLIITIPILAGMVVRVGRGAWATRLSRILRFLCVAGVLGLCTLVITTRFDQLKTDWKLAVSASIPLALGAMTIGWATSRMMRMERTNSLTCSISFAVRNVGLAATIAITIMNRMEYAVFSTVYFLSEVSLVCAAVVAFRLWTVRRYPAAAVMESAESW